MMAKPISFSSDPVTLRAQAGALATRVTAQEMLLSEQRKTIEHLEERLSLCDSAALEAERQTNARLTAMVEELDARLDRYEPNRVPF